MYKAFSRRLELSAAEPRRQLCWVVDYILRATFQSRTPRLGPGVFLCCINDVAADQDGFTARGFDCLLRGF
jgi:hypothetical protein